MSALKMVIILFSLPYCAKHLEEILSTYKVVIFFSWVGHNLHIEDVWKTYWFFFFVFIIIIHFFLLLEVVSSIIITKWEYINTGLLFLCVADSSQYHDTQMQIMWAINDGRMALLPCNNSLYIYQREYIYIYIYIIWISLNVYVFYLGLYSADEYNVNKI